MRFSSIIGQQELKQNLIDSVLNNRVSHAQLFKGKEGSAALPLALAFSAFLNCQNRNHDSCGTCPSCIKIDKLIHPDLHFSFPVAPTPKFKKPEEIISQNFLTEWRRLILENPHPSLNEWLNTIGADNKHGNISKEESRQIIRSLSLKAFEGPYKIMIIWLPEYLHAFAANALLKALEEPPEKTVFLLVSNNVEQLISTILSRVQIRSVPAYSDEEVKLWLQNRGVNEDSIGELTRLANGNLNAASKLLNHTPDEVLQPFRHWMLSCFQNDYEAMVIWADDYQKLGKVAQKSILNFGITVLRESLLFHSGNEAMSRVNQSEGAFIRKFGKTISLGSIEKMFRLFEDALYHLERNANPKIIMLDLSLNIAFNLKH